MVQYFFDDPRLNHSFVFVINREIVNVPYRPASRAPRIKFPLSGWKKQYPFTSWSWNILGLYFGLSTFIGYQVQNNLPVPRWLVQLTFILWEIAGPMTLLIGVVVKYALWPAQIKETGNGGLFLTPRALLQHNANVIMAMIDLTLMGGLPAYFSHLSISVLYGCAYVVFAWCVQMTWHGQGPAFLYFFMDTTLGTEHTIALYVLLGVLMTFHGLFCGVEHVASMVGHNLAGHAALGLAVCVFVCRFSDGLIKDTAEKKKSASTKTKVGNPSRFAAVLLLPVSAMAFSPNTGRPHHHQFITSVKQVATTTEAETEASTPSPTTELDTKGMTERIMKSIKAENQATGAGGTSTWEGFLRAEQNWARLKSYNPSPDDIPPPPFVVEGDGTSKPRCFEKLQQQGSKELDYDIAICGGTLGIFFATALQLKGHKVCVVEAGKLAGREQEWNISMDEMLELKELGVLSQEDIDAAVQTEFPGCRSGFKNEEVPVTDGYQENGIGYECFTPNVLNLGVSPKILIERVAKRFESLGGVIKQETRLQGALVLKEIGAALDLGEDQEPITASLIMDAMGNNSPITRQQRFGNKPDGVCAVVGTCASGFDAETNLLGDIIYTNSMIQDKGENGKMQYFWEAFPVGIGRNGNEPGSSDVKTTYMFTYMDADERRPSLETMMEDYWKLLPVYQPSIKNPETDLDFRRVLFAYFPTYRESPLKPAFDRVLAVGDASGIQSPLSFGGFGALTRHLERITDAVTEAMEAGLTNKEDLGEINAYTPNLSAAWMFQKAMSIKVGQPFVSKKFINRLLATNFEVMDDMGPQTITPFLQDVVRFDGLVGSLARSFVADPFFMPVIVTWVGLPTLAEWLVHLFMMGAYSALDGFVSPWLGPIGNAFLRDDRKRYLLNRQLDAWRFGSGNDYDVSKLPKN